MFRQKAPRDTREANYAPGIEKMMEYAKMKRLQARLPPVEEVAHAIKRFGKYKVDKNSPNTSIEDTQAVLLLQSLRYCLNNRNTSDAESDIGPTNLAKLTRSVSRKPRQLSQAHLDLAKLLYEELCISTNHNVKYAKRGFEVYLRSLTWSGRSLEARELMQNRAPATDTELDGVQAEEAQDQNVFVAEEADGDMTERLRLWNSILLGFSQEGDEKELLRTLSIMKEQGVDQNKDTAEILLKFYVDKQDHVAVKQWWCECHRMFNGSGEISASGIMKYEATVSLVLEWCLASGNLALGHEIVKDVMCSNPSKPIWDAVLVWGAGTKKSVDEIGRMLDVMQSSNETIPEESE
jgi:hypothetical protein